MREKRRKELFNIENIRNSMKPIHMPAREYKMMLAKERKIRIDQQYYQLKLALCLKYKFIQYTRAIEREKGMRKNRLLKKVREIMNMVRVNKTIRARHANYAFLKKKKDQRLTVLRSASRLRRYLRNLLRKRGGRDRLHQVMAAQNLTLFTNLINHPIEVRARTTLCRFMKDWMHVNNLKVCGRRYWNRMVNIKKALQR